MAKQKSIFICQNCGYESLKWLGKCPDCNSWNTMVEEIKDNNLKFTNINIEKKLDAVKKIGEIKSGEKERYNTKITELNRVLGGGLVKGSMILISGDPGIGKSTLLLQTANNISKE